MHHISSSSHEQNSTTHISSQDELTSSLDKDSQEESLENQITPSHTADTTTKVVVVESYCTHAAHSDCARCASICPHEAITWHEEALPPTIDHTLCNGCGVCFGICDAFASTKLTMADLHARIRRIATTGDRVYITCRENVFPGLQVASNVIVLPCISMMPPELWTLLLAEKIRVSVACDLKYCDDCDRAGEIGGMLFPRAIEIAESRTGGEVKFSYRIPEKQQILDKYVKDSDTTERRAMFTGLASDLGEIASGKRRLRNSEVLADYYAKKERQRAIAQLNLSQRKSLVDFTPDGHTRTIMHPRRAMLLEAVERDTSIAPTIPLALAQTDPQACCCTRTCIEACPTGARSVHEAKSTTSSRHIFRHARVASEDTHKPPLTDPTLCIGCGICVDVCPHAAIELVETTGEVWLEGASKNIS